MINVNKTGTKQLQQRTIVLTQNTNEKVVYFHCLNIFDFVTVCDLESKSYTPVGRLPAPRLDNYINTTNEKAVNIYRFRLFTSASDSI